MNWLFRPLQFITKIDRKLSEILENMEDFKAALALLKTQIEEQGATLERELTQIADALNKPEPDLTEATLTLVNLAQTVKAQSEAIANIIPDVPPVEDPVEEEPEEEEPEEEEVEE